MTYLSDDINDMEPLFPNHFLLERYNRDAYMQFNASCEYICTKKRWVHVEMIVQHVW